MDEFASRRLWMLRLGEMGRLLGELALLSWRILALPVYLALRACESTLRMLMLAVAILGVLASLVLGLSRAAPQFPLPWALLFFLACGLVPWLYRKVLHVLAP